MASVSRAQRPGRHGLATARNDVHLDREHAAVVLELVLEGVPTALRDLERHERIDTDPRIAGGLLLAFTKNLPGASA